MSETIRRTIPLVITFLIGVFLILNWYIPSGIGTGIENVTNSFGIVIAAFAVMLGTATLYIHHIREVRKEKTSQRFYSIWTLFIATLWIVLGVSLSERSDTYTWLYNNIYLSLYSSTYASLGLFILAGAYRAFKLKTWESVVFVIGGMIMLLNNTQAIVAIFPSVQPVGSWIMNVATMSTFRGITIGLGLGSIALGIRTLMGMETGYLGKTEGE